MSRDTRARPRAQGSDPRSRWSCLLQSSRFCCITRPMLRRGAGNLQSLSAAVPPSLCSRMLLRCWAAPSMRQSCRSVISSHLIEISMICRSSSVLDRIFFACAPEQGRMLTFFCILSTLHASPPTALVCMQSFLHQLKRTNSVARVPQGVHRLLISKACHSAIRQAHILNMPYTFCDVNLGVKALGMLISHARSENGSGCWSCKSSEMAGVLCAGLETH